MEMLEPILAQQNKLAAKLGKKLENTEKTARNCQKPAEMPKGQKNLTTKKNKKTGGESAKTQFF